MQYIALIYTDETQQPELGTDAFKESLASYQAATQTYAADKVLVSGEPLAPTSAATTIRVRDGKTETMDGPFAETKEQLGGFYIFDCEDLDSAIKYAAMIPAVHTGCVEVRPILNLTDMD